VSKKFFSLLLAIAVSLVPGSLPLQAQNEPTLTIGSKAPEIDIEHWVSLGNDRFKAIKSFETDKVYVVEFWATWCGPCVQSMPHLVEMQNKFADKGVQIISVSDEDLETVEGFLSRKVRGSQEGDKASTYGELTRAYCLTTDPDGSVHSAYMNAAGQNGIPCCFIVGKTGQIEWIGHPIEMDEPLAAVVDNTWDRDAFASEFKAMQRIEFLANRIMRMPKEKALEAIEQARKEAGDNETIKQQLDRLVLQVELQGLGPLMQKNDIAGAMKLLDELATRNAEFGEQVLNIKMMIYSQVKDYAGMGKVLAEAAESDDGMMLNMMAWNAFEMLSQMDQPAPELLKGAIVAAEKAVKVMPGSGAVLDTLSHLVHIAGDLDRAIELQSKAVTLPDGDQEEIKQFLEELKKEKANKK
jgi:thiol-disulfide isomerase/thioredoxin